MRFNPQVKNTASAFVAALVFVALLALPEMAFAQTTAADAEGRVTGFIGKINSILNVASVAIVTIAVIFAGYQIAFAHKRISDVAPVLIGGFLIGAAAQLAKMVIPEDVGSSVSAVLSALPVYA
jgi:type IV secretion system protein VirB2